MNKKTLVIHPKDSSTDFLSKIYENKNWTILCPDTNNNMKETGIKRKMRKMIRKHDRIFLMGHGTPSGLLYKHGYVIDLEDEKRLKDKELMTIFCNSDRFRQITNLNITFYTGMIISEVSEGYIFGTRTNQKEVDESNYLFAKTIGEAIEMPSKERYEYIMKHYDSVNNDVIKFNRKRIYEG